MYSDHIHPNYENLYRVDISPSDDYYLSPGDILFVRSSVKKEGVGWPSLFQGSTEPMTYCGFLIRGRPSTTSLSSSFLVTQLRTPRLRHEIVESSGTTAITNISQLKLKAIEVKIPDQSKQVEVLSSLDGKLTSVKHTEASIQEELETIDAMPAALLRKAFNGEL